MEQTPEEKLLNIIRKKDSEKEIPQKEADEVISIAPREEESSAAPPLEKQPVISDYEKSFWDGGLHKKFFFKELKNFKLEREDLFLFLLLTFAIIFLNWFMGANVKNQDLVQKKSQDASMVKSLVLSENSVDFSKKYKKALSRKDIFTALPEKKRAKRKKKEKGVTIDDILKNLKLLGILWDDKPTAIIQSRKSKGTRYLSEGENIDGAVVEKIEQGRVILNYDGEKADLIL